VSRICDLAGATPRRLCDTLTIFRPLRTHFPNVSDLCRAASPSHFDDAMIRTPGKRMTVLQLKQQMDRRFDEQGRRFDEQGRRFDEQSVRMGAGFSSLHDKLNAILQILDRKSDHHFEILHEHEERLSDLETWRRTTRDV
jgi:hypothetical protein